MSRLEIVPYNPRTGRAIATGEVPVWDDATGWRRSSEVPIGINSLAGYPGDGTKALFGDGAWKVPPPGISVYDRRTTAVDVANSTIEKSLYDGSTASASTGWSIAAADMGANKKLRLTLGGDCLFNNNTGDTLSINVVFGGTSFIKIVSSATNASLSAARIGFEVVVEVMNLGATNSQIVSLRYGLPSGPGNYTITTGILVYGNVNPGNGALAVRSNGLGTIDTTAAQSLDVTAKWSAANANDSFRMQAGILELV